MLVVVSALALAGLWWSLLQRRRGRLLTGSRSVGLTTAWAQPGSAVTLVQFSSATCTACVRSARVWAEVVASRQDIAHRELDAADHLQAVRDLGIYTTPTTLLVDAEGEILGKVVGAPTPSRAAQAVAQALASGTPLVSPSVEAGQPA